MGTHTIITGIPSGLIAVWHGTIANIPSGWVICDGNNSTPNLLNRFVEGVATAATDPGATGGATSKAIPSHTLTVNEIPSHAHTTKTAGGSVANYRIDNVSSAPAEGTPISTTSVGGGGSHGHGSISDIRPKYYDVAFIMKT